MQFALKHATLRESRDPKPSISPSPLINVESELCQGARPENIIIKEAGQAKAECRCNIMLHSSYNYLKKLGIRKEYVSKNLAVNLEDVTGNQASSGQKWIGLPQRCHCGSVFARDRVERFSALHAVFDLFRSSSASASGDLLNRRAGGLGHFGLRMRRRIIGRSAGIHTQSRAARHARTSNIIPLLQLRNSHIKASRNSFQRISALNFIVH